MYQQYQRMKEQYPEHIVLVEAGDFYETFDGDAEAIAEALDILLLKGKASWQAMAGMSKHRAEADIGELLRKGYKVAMCEGRLE